jgi:putative ABC transport system permease protein
MKFLQDLRFGLRVLVKSPTFTAISVLTLALGIGANTAIFSIVYGMMLKPLPYDDPGALVYLYGAKPSEGWDDSSSSLPNYQDWREQATSFDDMGLYFDRSYNLTGGERPERVRAVRSTASLLTTLGVRPAQGRLFDAGEEEVGRHQVVLLFDGFWHRRFGGDPAAVGRTMTLDQVEYTIIGVLPPAMEKAWGRDDVWMPLGVNLEEWPRGSGAFDVMARLRDGVSVRQAQAEMITIASRLEEEHPDNAGWTVNVRPLMVEVLGEEGQTAMYTLMAAVFFILLIACANMANLLLARGNIRQKEVAIRTALGAGRWRLVRQMITECLMLSMAGGAVGTLLAYWGVDALLAMLPDDVPRKDEIGMSRAVLLFTVALSAVTPLLFGLAPAIATSGVNLVQTIKEGGRSASEGGARHRGRDALVVTQIALALALVVSAGLMIKSFVKLRMVDPGFDTSNLLTMRINLPAYSYSTAVQRAQFFEQATAEAASAPGVRACGAASTIPLGGSSSWSNVTVEGFEPTSTEDTVHFGRLVVTPGYFAAMGVPLLAGRDFTWQDTPETGRSIIINRRIAEGYWPAEDAVGRRIAWGQTDDPADELPWMTVIGVVDNVRHQGLDREARPEVYEAIAQVDMPSMTLLARTVGDPMAAAAGVQEAVWRVDPDQAIFSLRTMDDLIFEEIGPWDAMANTLGALASIALFLAAVGLYGLMAYNVSRRTQEIGIRMALGAQSGDVLRLVLRKSLILTVVGIVLGLGLAYGLGTLMQAIMYDVKAGDPMTFIMVIALLLAVALLATYVPARRALRIDPMDALRYE